MEPVVVVHEHSDALRALFTQALLDAGLGRTEGLQAAGAVMPCLEQVPADVLLLDLEAPDADVLALCRAVRARYPRLGIVSTCTRFDDRRLASCLEAGADHLLAKPLTVVEIAAHIRRLHERAISWFSHGAEHTPAGSGADQGMRF